MAERFSHVTLTFSVSWSLVPSKARIREEGLLNYISKRYSSGIIKYRKYTDRILKF